MRLYRALCAALEAYAASMSEPDEFGPEGAGEARSEFAHDYTSRPEMHSGFPARSIDDDDGGSYRFVPIGEGKYRVPIPRSAVTGRYKRPIGFTRNGE